jgi:Predicted AAA-ATPase/PD-(D/E)XK nuclease superfamily
VINRQAWFLGELDVFWRMLTFVGMNRKIAVGIQDFKTLISENYLYVDKSEFIFHLVNEGKYFFLARPRRFGKSMTLSTLESLYQSEKDLFQGLWIADKWDWTKKHPVLRMSLNVIDYQNLGLEKALEQEVKLLAQQHGVTLNSFGAAPLFRELILTLAQKQKVVVLIDEYDAPIINYLGKDISKAQANREILKPFYTVLKETSGAIELGFITGVTKFSKVGIFSGMNNLLDLTMHPHYATMLGYTQEELESNFAPELERIAAKMKIDKPALLDQIREWYNGYRFEESAPTVYNPVSLANFFSFEKFANFWFETGTPTFLINQLKSEGLYDFKLEPQSLLSFESFELEDLRAYGLLYQSGYLTIKSRDEYGLYELDYPNHEVKNAMLAYLLEAYGGVFKGSSNALVIKMEQAFFRQDIEKIISILQSVFAGIPYPKREKYHERFFHASVHLLFTYMGIRVQSEVCTSEGRIDAVVETDNMVYIIEFKVDKSADEALAQIRGKQYYQAYWHKGKAVKGLGINFSSKTRNITEWKLEAMD